MTVYIITGIVLLVYLVLAWFAGTWLHLQGSNLWILRIGLWVIGLAAAVSFLWFWRKSHEDAGEPAPGSSEDDILIHEAIKRLRASTAVSRAQFGDFPLIFFLGEQASTKTTSIVRSGLDPDLLAGQVYQDTDIIPTRAVNFWYTRQAVLVDVGGAMLEQGGRLVRVIKRLAKGNVSGAFGKSEQPARAAVICFDAESFLRRSSQDIQSVARKTNQHLQAISQNLGINFPVYVLFTKMDRITGFDSYVRNFTKDEATQVLGATLSMRGAQAGGVYAEEETKRLTKAFDEIFFSLGEKRTEFLAREAEGEKIGSAYEFPRELRKLRTPLVQFLVDLGRPSQMPINPFLRGFYFSGVRAVMTEENAPMAAAVPSAGGGPRGATTMFNYAQAAAMAAPAPTPVAQARRVPQWVFLTHLFNDVILKDRSALLASAGSTRVSFARRVLLATAAVLLLIVSIFFTVSFFRNRALMSELTATAKSMPTAPLPEGAFPALSDLQKLEALRQNIVLLAGYQADGPPFTMRWGLYAGDSLYPEVRKLYFAHFRRLLLAPAQARMLGTLKNLPATPDAAHDFRSTYDTLKAYLITTSNHDKSTLEFLSPVLDSRWLAGRDLDNDRAQLAQKQFDFYSAALKAENPYSTDNDTAAIERARAYLRNLGREEVIYQAILAEAQSKSKSILFNRDFPAAGDVVVDRYEVSGAFSKAGYNFVAKDALTHLDRYVSSEDWVLGPQSGPAIDMAKLQQQLTDRYVADFLNAWRLFLRSATVSSYRNLADADDKLSRLSNPTASPLLALVSVISQNTSVEEKRISDAFQPAQAVVPPGPSFVADSNKGYMNGLGTLQGTISVIKNSPTGQGDPAAVTQVLGAAANARQAVRTMAQAFAVTSESTVPVQKILEAPITAAENVLKGQGAEELNAAGRDFCTVFNGALRKKFPFDPASSDDASLDAVNQIFSPNGELWKFYNAKLKQYLVKQGSLYGPLSSTGTVRITPEFQRFFNAAAGFADAVYPNNSPTPRLTYTLQHSPQTTEGLVTTIDGQSLTAPGMSRDFSWPSNAEGVKITSKDGGMQYYSAAGPWGLFHFTSIAVWQPGASAGEFELPLVMGGQRVLYKGQPVVARYQIRMASPWILQRSQLAAMRCEARVAR